MTSHAGSVALAGPADPADRREEDEPIGLVPDVDGRDGGRPRGPDLRLVPVALVTWIGTLAGTALGAPARSPLTLTGALAVTGGLAVAGVVGRRSIRRGRTTRWRAVTRALGSLSVLGVLLVGVAAAALGVVAQCRRDTSPVAALGTAGRSVRAEAVVGAVPRPLTGAAPGSVLVDVRVVRVDAGGKPTPVDAPVTVLADRTWSRLRPGTRVTAGLHFRPRRGVSADAASATVRGPPTVLAQPGGVRAGTARIRAGLARVSAPLGQPAAGLLPAVVHGDTSGVPAEVTEQFRVSGLAHLNAVSGANVAVVVVAATGVSVVLGGGRLVSGIVGIGAVAGFAVLADLSPPVVRAGGTAVLVLLGARGSAGRGPAVLATAVTLLLLGDPWLATDIGFALSVSATAGIVAAGKRFGAALSTWLPGPVASAVGIGLAAQAACQPVLTAISGQVGMVAPFTNLAAEPAVAVATLAGLLAALLACVPGNGVGGAVAGWAAAGSAQVGGLACRWLAAVARAGAAAPGATADWAGTVTGVAAAVVATVLVLVVGPGALRRRRLAVAAAGVLAGLAARPVVLR